MQAVLKILDRELVIECSAADGRRLEDLARALNERLAGFSGDADAQQRLALTALSLLDEVQVIGAALVRARCEVERLADMLAETTCETPIVIANDERGRVIALRDIPGAA